MDPLPNNNTAPPPDDNMAPPPATIDPQLQQVMVTLMQLITVQFQQGMAAAQAQAPEPARRQAPTV